MVDSSFTHDTTVTEYFTGVADGHENNYCGPTRAGYLYQRRRELVAESFDWSASETTLDVGCGTGALATVVGTHAHGYTGIDVSPEMINVAKRDYPALNFAVARVENLPVASNTYDAVLALGVLEYVSPERLTGAIDEIARVLRPDGEVILSVLNSRNPIWMLRSLVDRLRQVVAAARGAERTTTAPEHTFSEREIRARLFASGLDVVKSEVYAYASVPSAVFSRKPNLCKRVADYLEGRHQNWLTFLGLAHLVVASPHARIERRDPSIASLFAMSPTDS